MAYDPQGGGYGQQGPPMQQGGPMGGPMGGGPMRGGWGGRRGGPRRRLSTETRRSLETSEFWIYVAAVIGVLVAAAVIDSGNGDNGGGGDDYFRADQAWVLVVVLTVGYMLSRGWAKSGAREFHWDDPEGRGIVDRMRDSVTGD